MSSFRSFLRQLNNYGFIRCLDQKIIRYQFSHPLFCRWDIRSAHFLQRRKPSGLHRKSPNVHLSSDITSPPPSEGPTTADMRSLANNIKTLKDASDFEFDPYTIFEGNGGESFVLTVED